MKALIVYESQWGNTRHVAEAIARGLGEAPDVAVVGVDDAPDRLPDDLDLLVVGGPTHNLSMSSQSSRANAERAGAEATRRGVREWIDDLGPDAGVPRVVTFDTRMRSHFAGSAAKAAAKSGKRHGLPVTESVDFFVAGREGPLEDGEIERATSWGRTLRDGAV